MITRFDGMTIWSSDLNRLLPFYRDTMGLPVALDSPEFVILGDLQEPTLCLGTHSEIRGPNPDPHRFLAQLRTDDIHGEVARLAAAGVPIYQQPEHQGDGFWIATCEDPDGNLVQLTYVGKETS